MQTSIFYYTNNLLSRKLLEKTLNLAINQCFSNNCELIITSHFPVLSEYENVNVDSNTDCYFNEKSSISGTKSRSKLYDYLVKDLRLKANKNCKNYVVGKLKYSTHSIFKQLLLSSEKCSCDKIILMEHDCFYPNNYIKIAVDLLEKYDVTYCKDTCFVNSNGFYKCPNNIFLSSFSFRKEIFNKIFLAKMEKKEDKETKIIFEPALSGIVTDQHKLKSEYLVNNHQCMSDYLGEDNTILETSHGLNSSGIDIYGEYFYEHPVWGKHENFSKLIDDLTYYEAKWSYGTMCYDY